MQHCKCDAFRPFLSEQQIGDFRTKRRERRQCTEKAGDEEHAPQWREIGFRRHVREREANKQSANRVCRKSTPRKPGFIVERKRETVARPSAEHGTEGDGGEGCDHFTETSSRGRRPFAFRREQRSDVAEHRKIAVVECQAEWMLSGLPRCTSFRSQ
jgi:hypothetical protein